MEVAYEPDGNLQGASDPANGRLDAVEADIHERRLIELDARSGPAGASLARSPGAEVGVSLRGVTIDSLWRSLAGVRHVDESLTWPPDVFALVDRALDASEAYRFVVSPPPGAGSVELGDAAGVAREWWKWLDGKSPTAPEQLTSWWKVVLDSLDVTIDELSDGADWHVIEALLNLHAASDEACAGLGTATAVTPGPGCAFRASARELLAEVGSLSRLPPGVLRVLPRCRTAASGISIQSLSRFVFVRSPQVDVEWHRMLGRPTGRAIPGGHANVLLLPWPLSVRTRDFQPVDYALPWMDPAHYGFFAFRPHDGLDLGLVDAVLRSAVDEAGAVDAVLLPEASITPADVEPLETLLGNFGVWCFFAGVRDLPPGDACLGGNWVHIGVRQDEVWRHATQHKHHRWQLDGRQIYQYHLGGALSPAMRWWEAVSIPRRSLQVIDQGAVTLVPLVCEDLARPQPVSDIVRSIGPSLVVTLLLDGPQLASRWTARYASVLADEPGSAVCALTSYGMVRRSRPAGRPPSRIVALWKDVSGELTEIALEDGADAILLTTNVSAVDTFTADGRKHPRTATLTLAAVQSLRVTANADEDTASSLIPRFENPDEDELGWMPELDERELSKVTSWAQAFAEGVIADPSGVELLLARANAHDWRTSLGLPSLAENFEYAIASLRRELRKPPTPADLLEAASCLRRSGQSAEAVTGRLIEIALEQRILAEVQGGRLTPGMTRKI